MRTHLTSLCALLVGAGSAMAQSPTTPPPYAQLQSNFLKPRQIEGGDPLANLKLPDGYKVEVFAKDLVNPRIIAVADNGAVYVTRRAVGDVVMLKVGADGKAAAPVTVASRPQLHGIAIKGDKMWLATVADVFVADIKADGTLGDLQRIINDLPDGGQHPNRTMGFGPDGMLYISVGSTCNTCIESRPESATILQASPDGKQRRIFASGLRNTIGFDWRPGTSELWGWDQSYDFIGDEVPREEINRIEDGKFYGWPQLMEDNKPNPINAQDSAVLTEEWIRKSTPMALGHRAHSAGMQFVFAKGGAFAGDAFVTLRGSWNAKPARGYEVVRIDYENGKPVIVEPFLTGFLQGGDTETPTSSGRPVGLAFMPDGSMLVSSDTSGVIYRVTGPGLTAAAPSRAVAAAPVAAMQTPEQLAIQLVAAKDEGRIAVTSRAFGGGGAIPFEYSAFGGNASPDLAWSKAPEGAKSYVILMEDPDAAKPKPYVHWIAYNIPPTVTALRAGMPTDQRLEDPKGVLQGVNSSGASGYFGPKPPDSKTHSYHFQVFALDTTLDLLPGADRKTVLDAMAGHVLAKGELVGEFATPASQ